MKSKSGHYNNRQIGIVESLALEAFFVQSYLSSSIQFVPEWWPSGRASTSQPVGHGFKPWLNHTKHFKNGTYCLLAWSSTYENGVGKLKSRSYQWTSPPSPAVAFTAFPDAWPGAIETEIGAALCSIGCGKGL